MSYVSLIKPRYIHVVSCTVGFCAFVTCVVSEIIWYYLWFYHVSCAPRVGKGGGGGGGIICLTALIHFLNLKKNYVVHTSITNSSNASTLRA